MLMFSAFRYTYHHLSRSSDNLVSVTCANKFCLIENEKEWLCKTVCVLLPFCVS